MPPDEIAILGSSGFVGQHLFDELAARGVRLHCLERPSVPAIQRSYPKATFHDVEIMDASGLAAVLRRVAVAYYLVHSMHGSSDYLTVDQRLAQSAVDAARQCGLRRIVFIGSLGPATPRSAHLRSRKMVGAILRSGLVDAVEYQMGIILGSGSLSDRLFRAVAKHLFSGYPTFRATTTLTQPLHIATAVKALVLAADSAAVSAGMHELGALAPLSFQQLILDYTSALGRPKRLWPVLPTWPIVFNLGIPMLGEPALRDLMPMIMSLDEPTIVTAPSPVQALLAPEELHVDEMIRRSILEAGADTSQ